MKRILTIFASVAMIMTAVSCEPEQTPQLSFGKSIYTMLADEPVTVDVVTNIAPSADLTIELAFTGEAVLDSDYSVSATSVVIPAGQVKGSVTISPLNNFEAGKSVIVSVKALPAGYVAGKNPTATVTIDAKEKIYYSFAVAEANVVDRYVVKLKLSGFESGDDWVATADMEIPYTVTPALSSALTAADDAFVVKKGENVATLVVNAGEIEGDPQEFVISVDADKAGERFNPGTTSSSKLIVSGLLKLSSLLGTWEYSMLIDDEDYFYFMYDPDETGDDYDLLPIDNEGFKLTFYEAEDENGNFVYKVKPEGTGDWNDYFRDAVIDYRSPINTDADAEVTGPYSAIEYNMFATLFYDEEPMVYFSLDKVNRSFSPTVENIGEGAISMWIDSEGQLVVSLKDYDKPPFANYWWMEASEENTSEAIADNFAEMFSFASIFTKVTE